MDDMRPRIAARSRALTLAAISWLLASCGGGGDGTSHPTIRYEPSTLQVSAVARQGTTATVIAVSPGKTVKEGDPVYIDLRDTGGYLGPAAPTLINDERLRLDFTIAPIAAAGKYSGNFEFSLCKDAACTSHYAGSPFRLPYTIEVSPNIEFPPAQPQSVSRPDPAAFTIGVALPSAAAGAAGALSQFENDRGLPHWVASATFDGAAFTVQPKPLPPGIYQAVVWLDKAGTPYRGSATITYTVTEPPGGISLAGWTPWTLDFDLMEGGSGRAVSRFTRSTWSPNVTWAVQQNMSWLTLRDLGGDQIEISVDARGLATGFYSAELRLNAGDYTGQQSLGISMHVNLALQSVAPIYLFVGRNSTVANLEQERPVNLRDGSQVRWTASSAEPWLKLVSATGLTGVDPLRVTVDPGAVVALGNGGARGMVRLSTADPAHAPLDIEVSLDVRLPRIVSAGLDGIASGQATTVMLSGEYLAYVDLAGSAVDNLSVSGAAVRAAGGRGSGALRVDLEPTIGPGPVTLRMDNGLGLPTQVQVPVLAVPTVSGYGRALPYAVRRPPAISAAGPTVWFASGETAVRLRAQAGSWQEATVGIPGLIDLDLTPDAKQIVALVPAGLRVLDSESFGTVTDHTDIALLRDTNPGHRLIASGADQLAWLVADQGATVVNGAYSLPLRRFVGSTSVIAPFNDTPRPAVGLLLGPRRDMVLRYGMEQNANFPRWSSWLGDFVSPNTPGSGLTDRLTPSSFAFGGTSRDGNVLALSTGEILQSGNFALPMHRLAAPLGLAVAGVAISADGSRAYAYAHSLDGQAGKLLVYDLPTTFTWPTGLTPVRTLPLPIALGCVAPLPTGATCAHNAHVALDLHESFAMLLGPQGLAIVPLADATGRGREQPLSRAACRDNSGIACRLLKAWPRRR